MNVRKISVWGFVVVLAALWTLSYFGNPTLFYVFTALTIPYLVLHVVYICRRCTNVSCSINPKSADFFLKRGRRVRPEVPEGYSDLNAAISIIPMALLVAVASVGVWQLSPYALLAIIGLAAVSMAGYQKQTCANCTNNCINNRNVEYWEWRDSIKPENDFEG